MESEPKLGFDACSAQMSLRNLRKLDCYANGCPPSDQVRGHASLENALILEEGSDGRLDRQTVGDRAVAVESLQRRVASGAAIFAWRALRG